MIHHVKDISQMGDVSYSYCPNPKCNVVYFHNKEVLTTNMINKEIGIKDQSSDRGIICYCYNYLKSELYEKSLIDKINIRIGYYGNRCDLRNPSGRCCLVDIKKVQDEKEEEELYDIFRKRTDTNS
jgi:hypothetical protein